MAALPFHVKAVYEYSSEHDDDLSFPIGQIIIVTEIEDDDWYVGEYNDATGGKHNGLFPKNYVERYEPPAPPRPSRPRPKKEAAPAVEGEAPVQAKVVSPVEPEEPIVATSQPEIMQPEPVGPAPVKTEQPPSAPKPAKPAAAVATKESAPEPAPKPSSFRERIAAFNKPAAPPVAPKPVNVGGGGQTFIKKPYVAPPPSRNAYVPPPTREAVQPQKTYRREEDPEIAEAQAQAQRDAEQAGLAAGAAEIDEDEDAPKATSLKDRIAMLQKQQQEQAARQAEAAAKKEHKRPAKPRSESQEPVPREDDIEISKVASPDSGSEVGISKQPSVRKPPVPQSAMELPPPREIPSDGNDADQSGAGDTTEDQEDASDTEVDDVEDRAPRARQPVPPPAIPARTSVSGTRDPVAKELEAEEEQEEEEEEMDPETRRKEELRARMAKMSGGMGMAGFFNPAAAAPPPQRKPSDKRTAPTESRSPPPPPHRAPMVPVPGMGVPPKVQSPDPTSPSARTPAVAAFPENEEDAEETMSPQVRAPPVPQERPLPPAPQARAAPPVPPAERPIPVPSETRAAPPPPPAHATAPHDLDSDGDEATPLAEDVPAIPTAISTDLPVRSGSVSTQGASKRNSQGPLSATYPSAGDKRMSRPPPPIPGAAPVEARAPPPPPPGAPPSRSATAKDASKHAGDGESDYEGDYDTDIASAVPHKDALKAHEREPSIDEGTLSEDTSAAIVPPPIPAAQRAAPPPPPHQAPVRRSTDQPRGAPPAPPSRAATATEEDYDPYRHDSGFPPAPAVRRTRTGDVVQESDPSLYEISPQEAHARAPPPLAPVTQPPPPQKHAVPPPLPPEHVEPVSVQPPTRQSTDLSRRSLDVRRSMDPSGRPGDGSAIARDVDLGESSLWWSHPDMPPPVFQNRPDVAYEIEESSTSKRGGRTTVSKDVYVLFQDYSQTIVSARFDAKDPGPSIQLEQRHEPPPARLRQDELETAHEQFGAAVAAAAAQKQGTIGDGSPQALINDLFNTAAPNALKSVGSRAYGVLVYANMANASVQQHDEIRPGDIVSFRNARFQGKHGAMHAKYSLDVGKPEHVAVVMEWDGTKKKIRAWEQGRDKERKVHVESFKVGDLRSGEVKVWRVVGRGYVGWESN